LLLNYMRFYDIIIIEFWDGRKLQEALYECYPEFSVPKKEVQFPEVDDMQ
jgi:hypothetical protein